MPRFSAGLLLYRDRGGGLEVLIGHPGGPFWARKDDGAWSILKGEYADGEEPWVAAQREFAEETGLNPPAGPRIDFEPLRQPSGKILTAFAVHADLDVTDARSNTFEMEWPRGSGKVREFPEIDRLAWFSVEEARTKLLTGHRPILDQLMAHPDRAGSPTGR